MLDESSGHCLANAVSRTGNDCLQPKKTLRVIHESPLFLSASQLRPSAQTRGRCLAKHSILVVNGKEKYQQT